jgi:hypothetical protein
MDMEDEAMEEGAMEPPVRLEDSLAALFTSMPINTLPVEAAITGKAGSRVKGMDAERRARLMAATEDEQQAEATEKTRGAFKKLQ